MQWDDLNTTTKIQLKQAIYNNFRPKDKRDKAVPFMYCACFECPAIEEKGKPHLATDVHHLDGNHSNNDPANLAPARKVCHSAEHGITPQVNQLCLLTRSFYGVQEQRKALANRIFAYERLHLPVDFLKPALADVQATEDKLEGYIKAMLKHDPFYNAWLKHVKGISHLLGASLIADIGSPERFQTVGQLWAYAGEHVIDGKAPRRKKGVPANWNGNLRMTLFKVTESFVRLKNNDDCFGRQLYDEYRAYYVERDGPEAKGVDKKAKRRVAKDFLRCMWLAWLESRNLPQPGQPHRETKVFPEDWVKQLTRP